jgi:hypothetical protein
MAMAIPNATSLGPQNGTHPVHADQTPGDHFRSRRCFIRGSASPIGRYHHHRRHGRNLSVTVRHLLKSASSMLRKIQLP